MRAARGGSIVNISSIAALVGLRPVAYSAAKGAIRIFTKAVAVQYAEDSIRANSIHPGFALTPMTAERYAVPAQTEWRVSRTPLGRLATADDIAYGAVYLASDESSYVTGAELVIDGGFTAQ